MPGGGGGAQSHCGECFHFYIIFFYSRCSGINNVGPILFFSSYRLGTPEIVLKGGGAWGSTFGSAPAYINNRTHISYGRRSRPTKGASLTFQPACNRGPRLLSNIWR